MKFHLITIFPKIFDSYLNESILKRAQEKKQINIKIHNLRKWATDKHKTVDDTPYGGGAGMLMKVEPVYKAIQHIIKKKKVNKKRKIVLLSPGGKKWNQNLAKKYSKLEEVIFICGRYEGVDARIEKFIDEKISVGDYVLTGGELPALTMIDSITRLLPNVLGNKDSLTDESHSKENSIEYPQYTRPETFTINKKKYSVPKVLLSGNHKEIEKWKQKNLKSQKS